MEVSLQDIDWTGKTLNKVVKETYKPSSENTDRDQSTIDEYRQKHGIKVIKGDIPNPALTFDEVGFSPEILQRLERCGFHAPLPIQAQGWPIAMNGNDLIAIGETGSGKTLGFLLPALAHIENQEPKQSVQEGPAVLIISPTRELADQIHQVARSMSRVPSACLVGGTHKHYQRMALEKGAEIVVCTPGRLIDMLSSGELTLNRTSFVVLDEADRMLDMGFEDPIRSILGQIRPDKQLLLWSATWPEEVQSLARDFISKDHAHLNIGSINLRANRNIRQEVTVCADYEKDAKLLEFLKTLSDEEFRKILIFTETKRRADYLASRLQRIGFGTSAIHGNKTQRARTQLIRDFKSGRLNILIATNVASRGLDVDNIKLVINYDFPNEISDYVHRIGRTGRNNNKGRSMTFFSEERDRNLAQDFIEVLKESEQEINPDLLAICERKANYRKRPRNQNRNYSKYSHVKHHSRQRYLEEDY